MPNPIDAGADIYDEAPNRDVASTPDDRQAAALVPDHQHRHTPNRDLRDDTALAELPAGHERSSASSADRRTMQHVGIHAMGSAATEVVMAAGRESDKHSYAAQRVGSTALTESVHEAGIGEEGQAATDEAGGGDHGGPRGGSPSDGGHEDDDQSGDGGQGHEHEPREPGTMPVTELQSILDKIATYGAKVTDESAPPRVDLAVLQQRLDTASKAGVDTLQLDPAEVVELAHVEPQPSQLDKLAHFDDSETSRQPVEDRILTERTLSLLPITRREILIRSNPMGGSQDTATIADRMGKTEGTVQQQRWRAQQDFTQLADRLQRGDLDLKQYGIDHPKSRSPLTLLARLDVPIPADARMEQLRETGRSALRQTPLNNSQRSIMAHLWGLHPGQQSVSTADLTAWTGYRGTSILNIERVMFGLQSTNYHPERTVHLQARDEH